MAKYRILVVDDDPDMIVFIKTALGNNYEIVTSMDGEESLVKFKECDPDLLLLDVMMPGMSGYEVCQEIRKMPGQKEFPIIMLSALDSVEDHKAGYREGATFYLTKPIPAERLLRNIEVQLSTITEPRPKKATIEQIKVRKFWKETRIAGADETKPAPAKHTAPETSSEPRPRILVIDDDIDILRILNILFEKDYELIVSMDGVDALRKVTAYEPDMMIIDIVLPKVNGIQVCSAVRKIERNVYLPIIFLTGKDDPKIREMAVNYKALYVIKPCNYQELLKNVQKMIAKSPTLGISKKIPFGEIPLADRGVPEELQEKEKVRWMD